ncbi:MAG: RES family NAD+ phosphorylase [Ekhidna sp.]|nr:RES family NAD+ phosphorylase [Ekhidna sp.]MBC6427365.1 RES family NAD+ phosphorylase [Ekhidna sp.]
MEVYRISHEDYSTKLTSSGSANRWNFDGRKVIYTGQSRALSSLELVVHRSYIKPAEPYKMMIISIADEQQLYSEIKIASLPANWRKIAAYSDLQKIGSKWYKSKSSLILKAPSAIIPYEYNYIINTEHPDFAKNVRSVGIEDYFWDDRLL